MKTACKTLLSLILCIVLCLPTFAVTVANGTEYTDSFDELVLELVECMANREPTIVLNYTCDSAIADGFFDTLLARVFEHTGDPRGGDYLRYHYGGYKCSYKGFIKGGTRYYTITFNMQYYSNAEQEAAVDRKVDEIVKKIEETCVTDYEKIVAIYRFVTDNTVYDDENLNDPDYLLKYTAYAALINNTAVCQGYSTLMYRLALELGIDCRVITGIGNGGGHAWNIIDGGNGKYYLFDSTWDANNIRHGLEFANFFKGSDDFADHAADEKFLTAEFTAKHPISKTNYVLDTEGHTYDNVWYIDKYATSAESGEKSRHCTECGQRGEIVVIHYVHAENIYKNYELKSWSEDGINFVSSNGFMGDTGSGDFSQTGKMTRSMFVTVLYRMAGSPKIESSSPFTDLDPSQSWYHNAVIWAYENGVVTGTSATTFAPNAEVTREQIATFLYRYTVNYLGRDVSGIENDISSFPDASSVADYAREALTWANGVGLIKGQASGGTSILAPKNDATREEVAVVISRFCTAE